MMFHIARAAALSLTAVLALAGCTDRQTPTEPSTGPAQPQTTAATTPQTTAPSEPTSPDPEPETTEPFDPLTGEPAPPLPESFGQWSTDKVEQNGSLAIYMNPESVTGIGATVWPWTTRDEVQSAMPDSVLIGEWLCGSDVDMPTLISCTANVWDGTIQFASSDLPPEDLAAAGNELLAVWG